MHKHSRFPRLCSRWSILSSFSSRYGCWCNKALRIVGWEVNLVIGESNRIWSFFGKNIDPDRESDGKKPSQNDYCNPSVDWKSSELHGCYTKRDQFSKPNEPLRSGGILGSFMWKMVQGLSWGLLTFIWLILSQVRFGVGAFVLRCNFLLHLRDNLQTYLQKLLYRLEWFPPV